MAVSSRFRRLAPVVAALLVLAIAATAVSAFSGPTGKLVAGGEERVLRLHDLPPGYRIGDDSGCGPLGIEGASPEMASFVEANWPEGCVFQYERLFRAIPQIASPPLVTGIALELADEDGAKAGTRVAPDILAFLTGATEFTEVAKPAELGEEAWLFHTHDALVEGRAHRPGVAMFWRDGSHLAAVYLAGRPPASAERMVMRFAYVEQTRVEHPSPYLESERDDVEVPLDNPGLGLPVFWVGRDFKPGHGLPAAQLEYAYASKHGVGMVGQKVRLEYSRFSLGSYARAGWKRYLDSKIGRLVRTWRCTDSRAVDLPRGHAVIFSGYAREFASCPRRPPTVHFADVHLGRLVLTINAPICTGCLGESGAYSSTRGLETIARGLKPRPRPVY
jgi:hypothetical protein